MEKMEKDFALILELLDKKGTEGIHWYKLNRLILITDYSFASGQSLGDLTDELLKLGLIEIIGADEPLAGYWVITDKGREWLANKGYDGSIANKVLSRLMQGRQDKLYMSEKG